MSDDAYKFTLKLPDMRPRVTHRIIVNGETLGYLWSNGGMTMFDGTSTDDVQTSEAE